MRWLSSREALSPVGSSGPRAADSRVPLCCHFPPILGISLLVLTGELLLSGYLESFGQGAPGQIRPWAEPLLGVMRRLGAPTGDAQTTALFQVSFILIAGTALYAARKEKRRKPTGLLLVLAFAAFLMSTLFQVSGDLVAWRCQCIS